jgi:cytochrome c
MSGDLKWNKILGAGLATALVVLGLREITDRMFPNEMPKTPGFKVAVAEDTSGGAEAADTLPDWGTVLKTADIAAGEATFAKCKSCHNNDPGGPNGTGPNLNGVVGRAPASHAGFAYSDAMKAHAAKAPAWTYDELYQFLKGPQNYISGTKMTFAGVKDSKDRINLIAYLRSVGSSGYPIPAPDPKRAPGAAAPAGAAGATAAPNAAAGQTPPASAGNGGPAGQTPVAGAAGQSPVQAPKAANSGAPANPGETKK